MKSSFVFLAVAGLASALNLADYVPECSLKCLQDAIKSGTPCSLDDSDCICVADNYRKTYDVGVGCVLQACGPDVSTGKVLPAAAKFCEDVLAQQVTGTPATVSSTTLPTTAPSVTPSGTVATAATTTTASPAGAATLGSIGAVGMLALGALAAF